jgi:2-haloacid dehalogenase
MGLLMTGLKAVVFDAYGTLFDVSSIAGACRKLFGGDGDRLCVLWRAKQLEYTWLRSLMGHYEDFDRVTSDALRHCSLWDWS